MANARTFIGFPEGILRGKPVRLPVIENKESWYAVNKLSGLLGKKHPWFPGRPDVSSAIRRQLESGKPELDRLGITGAYPVFSPEPDLAGPMILAKNSESSDFLRNALGSNRFRFEYLLVTAAKVPESSLLCDLPIGTHRDKPCAVISHRYGKKSSTKFTKLQETASISLWRAETELPRMDQVRIHAFELGIPVFKDNLYCGEAAEPTVLAGKAERKLLSRFSGLGIGLTRINVSLGDSAMHLVEAPLSKPLLVLLNKCGVDSENKMKNKLYSAF